MQSDKTIIRVLAVLTLTQIVGWGTYSLPSIVSRELAADLHMSVSAVFFGTSVQYLLMGLCAPPLARAFARHGARRVLIAGTALAAPGFVLLGLSQGPMVYFMAWVVLGAAGAGMLTTAAYILLNEIAGKDAKGPMGILMLLGGLSYSIFWPVTAFLARMVGWRGTCFTFAAMLLLLCLPLCLFGLPRRARPRVALPTTSAPSVIAQRGTFRMIAAAIVLNAFVTYGFSAILVELLRAEGLSLADAIFFGSLLGVIQVGARGIDLLGGRRWDGITTGILAGIALPIALMLPVLGNGAYWSVAGFILLFGLASGALAIARATMPLVFFDSAAYARTSSHIALPLNMAAALAPPLLAGLLTRFGSTTVLGVATICSGSAVPILLALRRRRPPSVATSSAK